MNVRKDMKRENLLAETLDSAGLLAPLMGVMLRQLETQTPSFVRGMLEEANPDLSSEELDDLAELY